MATRIGDLKEGDTFTLSVWVKTKKRCMSKTGREYLSATLADRTGECDARIWDHIDDFDGRFDASDFANVSGRIVAHQGHLQAHLSDVQKLTGVVDYAQFLPASRLNPDAMYGELLALIAAQVDNPFVKQLLLSIFNDADVAMRYKLAPAARTNHHAYLSGLLEHSLGLAKLGLSVLPHYPKVDKNIVLAGLLLHDIGKIYELSYAEGFNYTDSGKLVGHLIMGVELLSAKAREIPNFPEETLLLLKHTIAGHHGELAYGSPVVPQTLEAIMVHFLDNMDSKLASMQELLEKEATAPGNWTPFHQMYGRTMYKTEPFRAKPEPVAIVENSLKKPVSSAVSQSSTSEELPSKRSADSAKGLSVSLADKFQSLK